LERTSEELRALAGMTIDIQWLVSRLLHTAAPADAASLRGLQTLDHVSQTISGIAKFLEALAGMAPADCGVDAASAARVVTLSGLAARLSFADAADQAMHFDSDGDFHLF
jgi:hypothetical protein